MRNVLLICDSDINKQSFIREAVRAFDETYCQIRIVTRRWTPQARSWELLYNGFVERSKFDILYYLPFFYLKFLGAFSKRYRQFLGEYADWPISGRVVGTACALPWHRIRKQLRSWSPDLIHAHFAWNVPYALPLARELGIPIVCTVHGSDIYLSDEWKGLLSDPSVRKILCVSDGMKRFIDERSPDLRPKTVSILNPVNEIYFENPEPPAPDLRVVVVAAFRKLKNHRWLLKGLKNLADRGVDFNCAIVGEVTPLEPEIYDELVVTTQELGLTDQVKFQEWCPPNAIKAEIDRSTVLVLPSESEGFGMVIAEALARQRTPVATDLPGTRDAMGGGKYGYLVPLNDVEALADALLKAHEETIREGEMVREGRNFVRANCHPAVHMAKLKEIYEWAIGGMR